MISDTTAITGAVHFTSPQIATMATTAGAAMVHFAFESLTIFALQVSDAMVVNMIEDEFEPLDHNNCKSAEEADVSLNVSKIGQRVSAAGLSLLSLMFWCVCSCRRCWQINRFFF